MHFGGHIGFLAAILDFRQNLRWPRSIFQIMWSKVHESTEKTLTGKKAVFTWLGPVYMQSVVGFSVIPKCMNFNDLDWLFRVKFCFRTGLAG